MRKLERAGTFIFALSIFILLTSGCLTLSEVGDDGRIPRDEEKTDGQSRPTPVNDTSIGTFTVRAQVYRGEGTTTWWSEDENRQLQVGTGAVRVDVTVTWDASTPTSELLYFRLGHDSGFVVAETEGTSPLRLTVDGDAVRTGTHWVFVRPSEAPGVMVDQEVHWNATVTYQDGP